MISGWRNVLLAGSLAAALAASPPSKGLAVGLGPQSADRSMLEVVFNMVSAMSR